jgi:proliferating cell nuclear antigen
MSRPPVPHSLPAAVEISVTKEGIKFSTSGDIGSANIICRQNTHADKQASGDS